MLEHRQANEGRAILERNEPEYDMTWTSMGTTNCGLRGSSGEHAEEFR
jgi:hypothetical protein